MDEVSTRTDSPDALLPMIEDWLSIPEAAQRLGVRDRDVRSMIADRVLLAVRTGGRAPRVPGLFLVEHPDSGGIEVVPGLRGTAIQLADAGFSDLQTLRWLYTHNDELNETPIQALRTVRTHAVRRAAQALAF